MNFDDELRQRTEYTDTLIKKNLPLEKGMQQRVIEAMNYSVSAGGKRLRPMLLLESYRLCGGTNEKQTEKFMAALECIHTYSLVHDDLPAMDNDDYRRGKLTTHKKYGEDFGILAGDGLLNYAYELLFDSIQADSDKDTVKRSVKAAGVIARKSGIYGMVGGQSLDVWLTDRQVSKEQLDFIFRLKTAALIESAFMAGAILAGADDETVKKMEKAGNLIGVAFQIQDDILDVTGTQEVLGKPVLSDEKNNKTTYVTLYGIEKARKDVQEMSDEALKIIGETGENEFLNELVQRLIYREK